MKKVLKRKVHPDLEVKNHKGEDEEANNEAGNIIDNNMNEGSDSSYFLPILRYGSSKFLSHAVSILHFSFVCC